MLTGKPGDWYDDGHIFGYYDDNGSFVICGEYGTAADFDIYAVQVQNGEGYYDECGNYVSFHKDED